MDTAGDRAAYSASQPLYDAFRNAVQRVDESRQLLELAMLEVRNEHVQARSDRVRYGATQQEQYVDRTVTAWRSITDAFASVFQEVSSLTESNLAEGRTERPGHKLLGTLHQTTIAARSAAQAFPVINEGQIPQVESRHQPGQAEQQKPRQHAKFKAYTGEVKSATPSKRVLGEDSIQTETQPSKVRCVEGEPAVIKDHSAPSDMHLPNQKSSRGSATFPGGHTQRSVSSNVQEELEGLAIGQSSTKQPPDHSYNVEYEDVSAEVEARLRAKEEKRKETKGEMKRKRNSTQSVGGNDVIEGSKAHEHAKPHRKKARKRKSGPITGESQGGESVPAESQGIKRGAAESADTSSKRARIGR